jgi:hypothetical protein
MMNKSREGRKGDVDQYLDARWFIEAYMLEI